MACSAGDGYDRLSELKAFDDTKAGVKGLVDAGVAAVPRIFHHHAAPPPLAQHQHQPRAAAATGAVPVIDLAAADDQQLLAQVKAAAETAGFFQVVNHGVPGELLAAMLAAARRFHEEPVEVKRPYYTRDPSRPVRYQSNFDLFQSPAANWRDTLFLQTAPRPEELPEACRGVVLEYAAQVRRLGAALLGTLSEALGLRREYLERHAGCMDGLFLGAHYYPPCPEPHLTMGTTKHSDPSFLTVLLQDDVGGLQVLLDGAWVDVPPVPGALVVNVGDFLQLLSNDRFRSVEHRVVATTAGPRVSVACFLRPPHDGSAAAISPLAGESERPRYRTATVEELVAYYFNKGLDGRSALDNFRLS